MTDDEIDTEALARARAALVGDLDDTPDDEIRETLSDITDDEIRKTTMYAVIRFNLYCRNLAEAIYDQVRSALIRPTDRP